MTAAAVRDVELNRGHDDGIATARRSLAKGSKSFALAGKLLPRGVRDDAAVIYAYCRRADDLVDEVPAREAAAAVVALRRELDTIVDGVPQSDPVLAAFQEVMLRRRIDRTAVDELLAGFAMDARPGPIVYQSWDELMLYCYRVAGTVGLMMASVMGTRDAGALRHAAALGMAMQLTNICRDVAEDWARGRLYLPKEALPPGAPPLIPGTPLVAGTATARALSAAVPALLAAGEPLYRWGDAGLAALDVRSATAVRTARLVYSHIGAVIRGRHHDVTAGRAVVSKGRKLWLLARAFVEVRVGIRLGRRWGRAPALLAPLPPPFLRLPESST